MHRILRRLFWLLDRHEERLALGVNLPSGAVAHLGAHPNLAALRLQQRRRAHHFDVHGQRSAVVHFETRREGLPGAQPARALALVDQHARGLVQDRSREAPVSDAGMSRHLGSQGQQAVKLASLGIPDGDHVFD